MTPEQKLLFDELTDLQQRTATNTLAGMTQRAAYYAAGGKANNDVTADSSAYEILSKPQVKAFMDSMKVQAVSDAIMSKEEMLARLTRIARTGITDIARFKTSHVGMDMESGEEIKQTTWEIREELQDEDPEKLATIFELEAGKNGPKIKMHSQIQAMAQLARLQGYDAPQKTDNTHRVVDDGKNEW